MERPRGGLVGVGAVLVVVFLFRLATYSITNDDYLHLSLAQQLLLGDVPVREFIDAGEPLFYSLSAAAQLLVGRNLMSEVLLDVLLLSVGYGIVFLLTSQASRSRMIGLLSTTIAVLLMPRLYSYPKIFLYAIALALMWRYIDRPSTRALILLAVWTAVAFLFRHDHGAAIGAAAGVMLAVTHWQAGWPTAGRKVLLFGAATVLLLAPFLTFLHLNGGLIGYWRNTLVTGRAEYERTVGPYPRFRPELASPRITVRWAEGVDASARHELERRFHLEGAEHREGNTWQYDLTDTSRQNVAALVRDVAVEDTGGVDRSRFTVLAQVTEPNLLAWFYYLTVFLPPLTIVALLLRGRRVPPLMEHEGTKVVTALVLALLMQPFLLRAASLSAVSDVSVLTAVLGAWLLRRGLMPWRGVRTGPPMRAALTLVVLAVTLGAAGRSDGVYVLGQLVATLHAEGAEPVLERVEQLRLSSPPFDDDGARYVFRCTAETDRLLVSGYAPDIYYKSGRGFAAGRPNLLASLAPLPEHERFSLEQLVRQRVPLALVAVGTTGEFAPFPAIDRYVRDHYRRAGQIHFGDAEYDVLVDTRIQPTCHYGGEGLPCFRPCDAHGE